MRPQIAEAPKFARNTARVYPYVRLAVAHQFALRVAHERSHFVLLPEAYGDTVLRWQCARA